VQGLSKDSPGLAELWTSPEWFEANDWNDKGFRLVHEGDIEGGLALLSKSARFGLPWALASYNWRCLETGELNRGIREFEACIEACESVVSRLRRAPDPLNHTAPLQLANARSNHALILLAGGGPLDEARATWEAGAPTGHVESMFYPALVLDKQGDPKAADEIVRALTPGTWFEIRDTLREGVSTGGWFGQWCTDGLAVLERTEPAGAVSDLNTLDLEAVSSLPRAGDFNIKEGLWDAVRRAMTGDVSAESALREFSEGGDATSWIARLELGALLVSDVLATVRVEEGRALFQLCLSAPYRDIIATAAWNLSEIARDVDDDSEAWAALSAAAIKLGDGTALRVTAKRLTENGDVDQAYELYERASVELSRGDPNRAAAKRTLAERDADAIDKVYSSWFLANVGALSPEKWREYIPVVTYSGFFNVDVAQAAVASAYFEECPAQCYAEPTPYDCGDRGRGTTTFLHAASAMGDGAYHVFNLYGPDDSGTVESVGVYVTFLPEDSEDLEFAFGGGKFLDTIASSAPLVLGTITCTGELIVADSSKSVDDADVSVRLEMPPGDYVVMCFLRPQFDAASALYARRTGTAPAGDPLTSVAICAVRGPLARTVVEHAASVDVAERDTLLHGLWGRSERFVQALFADIRPTVLAKMMEFEGVTKDDESVGSFLLQVAERDTGADDAIHALREQEAATAETLELLRQRGFVEPRLPWWRPTFANHPEDVWSRVVEARSTSPFLVGDPMVENVWTRRALARRSDLTASLVDALRQDSDERVRVNLATNPSLSSNQLAVLADDLSPSVRSAVAANANTSVDVLKRLSLVNPAPKGALTSNDHTPSSLLGDLARGATQAVRETLAARGDVPSDLAGTLASDIPAVRRVLAANSATPSAVLVSLVKDEDLIVRSHVAGNPSTPPQTLTELSLDGEELVRSAVMDNPASPEMAKAQASLLGAAPTSAGSNEPAAPTTSSALTTSIAVPARFCTQCGSSISFDHKFCSDCGAPILASAVVVAAASPWNTLQADWEIRGNFNVEGGSASVGTRIFEWCDCEGDVEVGRFCGACGRGDGNYVSMTSGAGDAIYPVFRLLSADGTQTGAIAMFEERWAVDTEAKTRRPADLITHARPVFAGSLTVEHAIYASEATAGFDGSYALVDIELPPGEYEVIAWQAEMDGLKELDMQPFLRQIALGVYSRPLVEALEQVMPPDRRPEAGEELKSRKHMFDQVMAHKEPRWADACKYNAREDAQRGEEDRAQSWLLQAAIHGDQAAAALLPANFLESLHTLDVARRERLMAMRGQRSNR